MDPFTFELSPFDSKSSSSEEDEINITQTFVATNLDEFVSTASSSRSPTFTPELFERRFRMPSDLFLRIVGDIEMNYQYFQTTFDARGHQSFTALQKYASAIRQLAYGGAPDALDEYLQMSERTSRESLNQFGAFIATISRQ
ncbi:hypothetical protein E3N88_04644 [Mikania micrantha]|uniref:Uncharacterized protein n=1 Tax=Mikania micrantha TaxID=192012 RepID=A0A5N6PWU7_9ASTR|nr:hypothetical protein E3N88_04644 [Mikania micrantha]